jgi:conflict system STAND superfamily ATPase/WD40 domain-containing protein
MPIQTNLDGNEEFNPLRPFLGLRSFEEKNKSQFGGRDNEIEELFELVDDHLFTVVFGKSGIGKTSLLKAGLMPQLRKKFYLPIYVRVDFNAAKSPLRQVRELVYSTMNEIDSEIAEIGEESLWEYLHNVKLFKGRVIPVLILDQFEEIFTLGKEKPEDVLEFITELADLAENRIPLHVKEEYRSMGKTVPSYYTAQSYRMVFSLREDYLARLEELKMYMPSIMENRFRVVQMTIVQALDAAIKPGKGLINEEVATKIITKLPGVSQTDFDLLEKEGIINKNLMVEPFLLSLICDRLNERRIEEGLATITFDLVSDFQMSDVINSFYDETLDKYDKNVEVAIEDLLLTEAGFRKLQSLEEMQRVYDISDDVIDELVGARILRKEIRDGLEYVELIHDVLAPVIKEKRDKRIEREREEERETALGIERAKNRAKNIKRMSVVGVVFLGVAIFAFLSARKTKKIEDNVNRITKAQSLLVASKSMNVYSRDEIAAALLTRTAFRIYNKSLTGVAGKNLFDQLYYDSMLDALKNLQPKSKHESFLELVNMSKLEIRKRASSKNEERATNRRLRKNYIKDLELVEQNECYYVGWSRGDMQKISRKDKKYTKETMKLKGNLGVLSIAYDSKKKYLAVARRASDTIWIYDHNNGLPVKNVSLPKTFFPRSLHFTIDGKLIAQNEGSIVKWDNLDANAAIWEKRDQRLWEWVDTTKTWSTLSINDASYVTWGENSIKIPDVSPEENNETSVKELKCFSVSSKSNIAIGIEGGIILLTEKEYLELKVKKMGIIEVLKFSPTEKYLIAGNDQGEIFIIEVLYNKNSDKIDNIDVDKYFFHTGAITDIAFHGDDTNPEKVFFATASDDGTVIKWGRHNKKWIALTLDSKMRSSKRYIVYS